MANDRKDVAIADPDGGRVEQVLVIAGSILGLVQRLVGGATGESGGPVAMAALMAELAAVAVRGAHELTGVEITAETIQALLPVTTALAPSD